MEKLTLQQVSNYLPHRPKFIVDMKEYNKSAPSEFRKFTLYDHNIALLMHYGRLILKPIYRKNKSKKLLGSISDKELIQMFVDVDGSKDNIALIRTNKNVYISWSNDNGYETMAHGTFLISEGETIKGPKKMFEWFYLKSYDLDRLIDKGIALNGNKYCYCDTPISSIKVSENGVSATCTICEKIIN